MAELPKTYEPSQVESRLYQFWLAKKYFEGNAKSSNPKYSVVIPPPNVTGSLHMGHALNHTIQDVLVRFHRMKGFNTLWLPGTDHAGIATQMVVEKDLAKQGIKKDALGREKFEEKVWEWKEKYGNIILEQIKRVGDSVDWSRNRFTLDEGLSKAVRKVFVDLYNEGLIYRGNRLVNWCPRCQTAVSDLEVVHTESKGTLWHIRYPISNDPQNGITVATTRPETMLGDTAVAVHPEDDRYKKLVGKKLKLPLTNREIPVIADSVVQKEFGSGAVKITPAHDFNDYETGKRNNLPMISIFDSKGVVNENGFEFKGLKNPEVRKKVVEKLTEGGFLVKEEPHALSLGKCQRCETIIEPMLSDQWFVKIEPLAKPAAKVVEDGKIKFYPENYKTTYLNWMYNIKDWCISRQLWWGHRIPAWMCGDCSKITVSMDDATQCTHCKSKNIHQDKDVLDTWFSSALWPFSTLGWPDQTPDLKAYYPTSTLVTGPDIIFFWVARMIMMGLKFAKDIPFSDVFINPIVRDEHGQKMSKTKGNVVDPLDILSDVGADTLRFTLMSLISGGKDIRYNEDRLEGYRNFINKIWNAARFSLTALADVKPTNQINEKDLTDPDRYILQSLKNTIEDVHKHIGNYRFTDAANTLYHFTWHEFCDWYIELLKPVLYGQDQQQKTQSGSVLMGVLDSILKLLHPLIPFVTEEIYQHLPNHGESITIQKYPETSDPILKFASAQVWENMEVTKTVITAIRNIRGENRIGPGQKIAARVVCENTKALENLRANETFIYTLAKLEKLDLGANLGDLKKCAVTLVTRGNLRIHVIVPLEGLVDFNEEIKRLQKDLEKTSKDLSVLQTKLSQETFVKNAPKEIVEQETLRLKNLNDRKNNLEESLKRLS